VLVLIAQLLKTSAIDPFVFDAAVISGYIVTPFVIKRVNEIFNAISQDIDSTVSRLWPFVALLQSAIMRQPKFSGDAFFAVDVDEESLVPGARLVFRGFTKGVTARKDVGAAGNCVLRVTLPATPERVCELGVGCAAFAGRGVLLCDGAPILLRKVRVQDGRWQCEAEVDVGEAKALFSALLTLGDGQPRASVKAITGTTTKLHEAAKGGAGLGGLERQAELVHALDEEGRTALFVASQAGVARSIPELVAAGGELEARAENGQTALLAAAEDCRLECVRALLKENADATVVDRRGNSALHYACQKGNLEVAKEVLNLSAIDQANAAGELPLHLAAAQADPAFVELLLGAGAGVNARTKAGSTAVIIAASKGFVSVVEALVKAGADVTATSNEGETVLLAAVAGGHAALAKILLNGSPLPDLEARSSAEDDATAVLLAARNGDAELVRALLGAGAAGDARDANGLSPMDFACRNGSVDCVRALLSWPGPITAPRPRGRTPLYFAARVRGEAGVQIVDLLLEKGAAHTPANARETPLCAAVSVANAAMVTRLLKAGARPEGVCLGGDTCLQRALANGSPKMCVELLQHGASIDFVVGAKRVPPLLFAIEAGWLDVAELLVQRGATVARGDAQWVEAAIREKREPVLKLLLDAGVPPCGVGLAMEEGSPTSVLLLLRAGAEADAACVELAVSLRSVELLSLVLSFGAPPSAAALRTAIGNGDGGSVVALLRAGAAWPDLAELDDLAKTEVELAGILRLLRKPGLSDERKRECVMLKALTGRTPADGTGALSGSLRRAIAVAQRVPRRKPA
jgi:ankyrin repeat protein